MIFLIIIIVIKGDQSKNFMICKQILIYPRRTDLIHIEGGTRVEGGERRWEVLEEKRIYESFWDFIGFSKAERY